MTTNDFQTKVVEPMWAEMQNIFVTKGKDYSGDDDRLANFKRVASRLNITPIQVAGVYLYKHLDAMDTWFRTGKLAGEPIEAKFVDIIAYILLLQGLNLEQQQNTKKT
jgi:hypothetical protein